jgi:chromosome partitioning protein
MSLQITCWTPKGGVGKTTLALSIAGCFAARGLRVLLVDRDPQGGALAWARLAKTQTPFVVSSGYAAGFDVSIFDLPPNLPEQLYGNLVMPTLLDAASHLLFMRGKAYAEREFSAKPIAVPFRVRLERAEQRSLLAAAFPEAPMVRDRAVFPKTYGAGQTVFAGSGAHMRQAQDEITAIASRLAS